jgi:cyclase
MIKKRIIPIVLIKNDNIMYKGSNFDCWRSVGNIINMVAVYNQREVDEMILLDVIATKNNNVINTDIVKHIASNFNMPLSVGGGITNIEDARKLFKNGADRVCINSCAYEKPDLITEISNEFGKQSIVISIDYRKINNEYYCFSRNCKKNEEILVIEWLKTVKKLGCGEVLITSYDNEGLMKGMDIDFLERYSNELRKINISIIFGGGIGNPDHVTDALKYDNVNAVATGSLFPFTRYTPSDVKLSCKNKNIPVRF